MLVGYLLVSNPAAGLVAVTFLMLVLFLVDGIARVVFALMIRPMGDWLWVLASGLVAIACAVVLFANLPEAASWLLGFLLGIHLICAGGALGFLAWKLRRGARLAKPDRDRQGSSASARRLRRAEPPRPPGRGRARCSPPRGRRARAGSGDEAPRVGPPPAHAEMDLDDSGRVREPPRTLPAIPDVLDPRRAHRAGLVAPRSITWLEASPPRGQGGRAEAARIAAEIERRAEHGAPSLRWPQEGATWIEEGLTTLSGRSAQVRELALAAAIGVAGCAVPGAAPPGVDTVRAERRADVPAPLAQRRDAARGPGGAGGGGRPGARRGRPAWPSRPSSAPSSPARRASSSPTSGPRRRRSR